eukprot:6071627-Amphidinium_carterae.1
MKILRRHRHPFPMLPPKDFHTPLTFELAALLATSGIQAARLEAMSQQHGFAGLAVQSTSYSTE